MVLSKANRSYLDARMPSNNFLSKGYTLDDTEYCILSADSEPITII